MSYRVSPNGSILLGATGSGGVPTDAEFFVVTFVPIAPGGPAYSITLDPQHDTPRVLAEFAETFGVGPGWKFLTGTPQDIERLRRGLGFRWATPEMDRSKDFHTGMLRYGNEPLMQWGGVPGMANAPWVAECVSFVDWPDKRPQLLAGIKARAAQGAPGKPPAEAHDHAKHAHSH